MYKVLETTDNKKPSYIKDAASLISLGLLLQDNSDYSKAKTIMKEGINKIKQAFDDDNIKNKGIITTTTDTEVKQRITVQMRLIILGVFVSGWTFLKRESFTDTLE